MKMSMRKSMSGSLARASHQSASETIFSVKSDLMASAVTVMMTSDNCGVGTAVSPTKEMSELETCAHCVDANPIGVHLSHNLATVFFMLGTY